MNRKYLNMPMPIGFLARKFENIRPLWQILSPLRRRQLFGLQILSLVAAAGEVANLGALLPFLGFLSNPTRGLQSMGPLASPLRALPQRYLFLALGLGFIGIVIISTLLRLITLRVQLQLSAKISADLGEQVFARVLQKPFPWHLEHNSSNVLGILTKDVDNVSASIQALLTVVVNAAIVLLLGSSLIALAPKEMFTISAFFIIFYLVVYRSTRGSLRGSGSRLTLQYQKSLQVAQEGLGGIRDVLLDSSQDFFINSYRSRIREYHSETVAINSKIQFPRYLIEAFVVVIIAGLSLSMALSGSEVDRQIPILGTLVLGAYRLLQPMQQCFIAFSSVISSQPSLERLMPFLQEIESRDYSRQTTSLFNSVSENEPLLEFKDVYFQYSESDNWVLHGFNLEIRQGERIAFVGSTGSGKSTTSDLILGLLKPNYGKILIHGQDLHKTEGLVGEWQNVIAHVPQQIYLSDADFAANIAFGVPNEKIDRTRVRLAADQARISTIIESSPEGYATLVGERGVRLSGGQRQRIGIARALYKQAKLLVLDEATSALDNSTEAEVMAAIEGLNRQITVIMIAHRLSTVQNCDRIILLSRGKIAGIGSYCELQASNPAFQALAQGSSQIIC